MAGRGAGVRGPFEPMYLLWLTLRIATAALVHKRMP